MVTLTVTAKGQVTLKKDVLQHLGIRPGDKIELDLLPNGRGILKAARSSGTIKRDNQGLHRATGRPDKENRQYR